MNVKGKLLWLWAKLQQSAEQNFMLILLLFVLNYFTIFWANYHLYQTSQLTVVLIDAVFLLVATGVYVAVLCLIPVKRLQRGLLWLSLLLSAFLAGFELFSIRNYQALVGAGMVTAVLQTNPQEAKEFLVRYVGFQGALMVLGAGVVLYLLDRFVLRVRFTLIRRCWQNRILPLLLIIGIGAGIVLWKDYHSFVVNNMLDIPAVQVGRALDVSIHDIRVYKDLDKELENSVEITENASDIPHVVFILGESTYRGRMHLYGYDLENTPNLDALKQKGEIAVFRDVISPQSATVAVLRELFTFHDVEDAEEWYHRNNFMDILKKAGYRSYWISNQDSSGIWGNVGQLYANRCTKKAYTSRRESHEEHGKLDEELFPLIDEARAEAGEKNFYMIHLMGAHSLYYMRFPYVFTKFTKDDIHGPQAELDEEKRTELAQYANALHYNDYIVSSIIDKFRNDNAIVIYLSDHGETIYDDGSSFAGHVEESPNKYTLEIPMIIWGSEKFKAAHPEKWAAILSAVDKPYMTDDMIHTLLDLMNIRTMEFSPEKSIIHPDFDTHRKRMVRGMDYDASMR